ncbi:unnamed protein product, partial [Amoebophrya sp. A120]
RESCANAIPAHRQSWEIRRVVDASVRSGHIALGSMSGSVRADIAMDLRYTLFVPERLLQSEFDTFEHVPSTLPGLDFFEKEDTTKDSMYEALGAPWDFGCEKHRAAILTELYLVTKDRAQCRLKKLPTAADAPSDSKGPAGKEP